MYAPGLVGELTISLWVIAPARAEVRVEVGGGVSLLIGIAAHVRSNSSDCDKCRAESVHVRRRQAVKRLKSGIDRVSIGYRNAHFGLNGLTLKNFLLFS